MTKKAHSPFPQPLTPLAHSLKYTHRRRTSPTQTHAHPQTHNQTNTGRTNVTEKLAPPFPPLSPFTLPCPPPPTHTHRRRRKTITRTQHGGPALLLPRNTHTHATNTRGVVCCSNIVVAKSLPQYYFLAYGFSARQRRHLLG